MDCNWVTRPQRVQNSSGMRELNVCLIFKPTDTLASIICFGIRIALSHSKPGKIWHAFKKKK